MKNIRFIIAAIMLLLCFAVHAATKGEQGVRDKQHFRLRYVINMAELDSTFVDNNKRMHDIRRFLSHVSNDSLMEITGIDFRGTASPDGTYEFNVWLSENRLRTFKELVRSYIDIPDSLIFAQSSDIPWDEFRAAVVADPNVPMRDRVLEIIDEGPKLVDFWGNRHIDHRLLKLKRLQAGQVWEYLKEPILFDLRYGDATFYFTRLLPAVGMALLPVDPVEPGPIITAPEKRTYTWLPRIYIKTNMVGWAATSANLSFEFDLAPHWSFALPIYYCGMDWIKSTIKFRNFSVQPEFRYWPSVMKKGVNDGFFIGAHFGLNYFNFAFDGAYRYQDRRGRTPALGGGLALGYRFPLSRNRRWHMEFSAGAGVYKTDYDVFHNTPNYKEGQWVRRIKKTYYGLDQAAITFSYNFGLRRHERQYVEYIREGGSR